MNTTHTEIDEVFRGPAAPAASAAENEDPRAAAPASPASSDESPQDRPVLTPVLDALDLVRAAMPYQHRPLPVDQFVNGPDR